MEIKICEINSALVNAVKIRKNYSAHEAYCYALGAFEASVENTLREFISQGSEDAEKIKEAIEKRMLSLVEKK